MASIAATIKFEPAGAYEKFAQKLYFLLVENFSPSYYVGGMVRDLLLGRPINDIDLATAATPDMVTKFLVAKGVKYDDNHSKFGIITVLHSQKPVEIATFRKDLSSKGRFPKVVFVKSMEIDSQRRDFSVNSLYFGQKDNKIWDFHNGLSDLKKKTVRFIGDPQKRIDQDPLRIVRALRLEFELNFKPEPATRNALEKDLSKLSLVTKNRIARELDKVKSDAARKKIIKIINKTLT